MFVEMRTYLLKPGTTAGFEERFVEGLSARGKDFPAGRSVAFRGGRTKSGCSYVAIRKFRRAGANRQRSQEDRQVAAENSRIHHQQENKIIQPAPFSPPLEPRSLGNVYEFRTYTYLPQTMPTVLERFGKVMAARTKVSPLVFAGHTLFGPLNQYIHVWAYKDGGERDRLRAEASKTVEGWPPATREFLVKQENMLMIPCACSPFK